MSTEDGTGIHRSRKGLEIQEGHPVLLMELWRTALLMAVLPPIPRREFIDCGFAVPKFWEEQYGLRRFPSDAGLSPSKST